MDTREVGRYWELNARAWTSLSRQGWDVYRDALNTPAFLALLPEIGGRSGLDIGCGDGHNTRLLAARGARMAGVDLVPTFIEYRIRAFSPHRRQLRNERGEPYAVELGRYFDRIDGEIDRWTFSAAPPETRRAFRPFEIPRFHRTLSEWLNAVVDAGFTIERVAEPHAEPLTVPRRA